MGYSHYIYRKSDFSQKQWENVCLETFQILDHCKGKRIALAYEYDSPESGNPEVTPDHIRFNGWKDEGHETFLITREKPENPSYDPKAKESFDFCKTNRKPYDLAVCLVMLSMKRHAPRSVRIGSDGDWDNEWLEARLVYKDLFGVEPKCPFPKRAAA